MVNGANTTLEAEITKIQKFPKDTTGVKAGHTKIHCQDLYLVFPYNIQASYVIWKVINTLTLIFCKAFGEYTDQF